MGTFDIKVFNIYFIWFTLNKTLLKYSPKKAFSKMLGGTEARPAYVGVCIFLHEGNVLYYITMFCVASERILFCL
jgi:hypothetical protein